MQPSNYNEVDADYQFSDALNRLATHKGSKVTIGTVIAMAKAGGYQFPWAVQPVSSPSSNTNFDLDRARPVYYPSGMPARVFAGPEIEGGARLFPMNAISLLVALGGNGKTTYAVKVAAHIAAGKPYGGSNIQQRKVIVFNVEENQDELNRKYGAAVINWADAERNATAENLRLISCLGMDVRLTRFEERQVHGTGLAEKMTEAAQAFGAEVIIIDHLQGFVSGDLNLSDTATALAAEANKIVSATGAAVVIAAHIAKHNIKAQGVDSGFTTGSLAFENAARQVIGIIPISDKDAAKYGLEHVRQHYLRVEVPKNSYGPAGGGAYLSKIPVPEFHTITVEPFSPHMPVTGAVQTRHDKLKQKLYEHITNNRAVTKNQLDSLAGLKGQFKASKDTIQNTMNELMSDLLVELRNITKTERKTLKLPRQVKQVYAVMK
jgi:RecA-family ATPase